MLLLVVVDVAGATAARTSLQGRSALGAGGGAIHLACLLYGALDTHTLHILVGRYLGVDVVSFEDEREREADHKKGDCADRNEDYEQPICHLFSFLRYKFVLSTANLYICQLKCKKGACSDMGEQGP